MLGSDSRRADPVVVQIDAALKDDVDHVLATGLVAVNFHAAFLPGVDHLFLTKPLTGEHDAIMRRLVEVKDVLKAEFNVFMGAAKGGVTVVDGRCKVSLQDGAILHLNFFTMEETVHVKSADVVGLYVDAHVFRNVSHVLFANKLVMDAEAAAVVKGAVKVTRAHQFTVLVSVAIAGRGLITVRRFVLFLVMTEMLDNDWVAWANFPAIDFNTLAKEEVNALLVTDLNAWLHVDAGTFPEVIQVFLAKPLRGVLGMELVGGLSLNTLVVLDMKGELVVANHRMAE